MLITIPSVLSKDDVQQVRAHLDAAQWEDGSATAGSQSAEVKRNQQLPPTSETAQTLGKFVLQKLTEDPLFLSAALPSRILPPMFNKYEQADTFGSHIDNAIRVNPLTQERLRTDLSMTLFLSEPEDYDGGALVVEDHYGTQTVKLPAGDMILYPATSLHEVTPVTRGARVSSFFWLQSMIRSDANRRILFDLDQTIQSLTTSIGVNNPETVRLTGIYHNLIRTWAETLIMKSSTIIFAAVAGVMVTGPAAALDPVTALLGSETITALLEQAEHDEMSPLGMFMAADWVVKAVMLSLLLASVLVWVIFLAKLMILRWERGVMRRRYRALDKAGSLDAARDLFTRKKGVVSQMVQAALRERTATGDKPELKSGIKERAGSEIARIEAGAARRMGFGAGVLANVGSVAPFVGLFGTVWGIMNSFISISESNTTNLAIVAPGIAEALLATAIGLVAAIPAVIFYNILARAMGGYKVMLADAGALVERTLSRDLDLATMKDAALDEVKVDQRVFRLGSVSAPAAE